MNSVIFANGAEGEANFGGNDKLFTCFSKIWQSKVITNEAGEGMYKDFAKEVIVWKSSQAKGFGRYIHSLYRSMNWLWNKIPEADAYFCASDSWTDVFPAIIAKLNHPGSVLVFPMLLPAKHPLVSYQGQLAFPNLADTIYWAMQKVSIFLMQHAADLVIVASKNDTVLFENTYLISGAVEQEMFSYPDYPKVFDFVVLCRLHPQKNLEQLFEEILPQITRPTTTLIIGDGKERKNLEELAWIMNMKAELQGTTQHKVNFVGAKFGDDRNKLIKSSKVCLFPSLYDTGSMAVIECMALGVPAVCYNLVDFEAWFSKGVIKVPMNDSLAFAEAAEKLLNKTDLYQQLKQEAIDEAKKKNIEIIANEIRDKIYRRLHELWAR